MEKVAVGLPSQIASQAKKARYLKEDLDQKGETMIFTSIVD